MMDRGRLTEWLPSLCCLIWLIFVYVWYYADELARWWGAIVPWIRPYTL